VPNQPATPKHGVRVPDELWRAAQRVAKDRGETVTAVILRALERYVRQHPLDQD
jgi:predicted transcriptional regulator